VAKNGTESEKKELLFKLKQYRLHSEIGSITNKYALTIDIMIVMLHRPENFPQPIDLETTSVEEQATFLRLIVREYNIVKLNIQNQNILWPLYDFLYDEHNPDINLYPIPSKSAFDQNKPKLTDIAHGKLAVDVNLAIEGDRWTELQNWSELFEKKRTPQQGKNADFKFHYDERMLSENEKDYGETFERDLLKLREDFNTGKTINLQAPKISISNDSCLQMHNEVSERIHEISGQLRLKELELLQKFNKQPDDITLHLTNIAMLGGGASERLSYEESLACLLSLDRREYLLKNPQLSEENVNELANLALQVADLKSYVAQLKRVNTLVEKIYSVVEGNPTRKHYTQELYSAIHAHYEFDTFDRDTQVALRIFSGETGLIPHKKQTDLIKKMMMLDEEDPAKFKDIVIQLIMGGGKTSVLATILMYLSAKKQGRLGLFIVPASLYDTVKINLGSSFYTAFHKSLRVVDLSREEMTEYKLQNLISLIAEAKQSCLPIVIKASTIQALELETLSLARSLRKSFQERCKSAEKYDDILKQINTVERQMPISRNDQRKFAELTDRFNVLENRRVIMDEYIKELDRSCATIESKLQLLATIVGDLPECADALIDEVDLALDALQQVNFPEGDRITIPAQRNSLLHHLFKALIRTDLKIPTLNKKPSIDDVVGLRRNDQSIMDKELYLKHVIPVLAEEIATNFEPIQNQIIDYKSSFLKYVTGKTPVFLEKFIEDSDLHFNEDTLHIIEPNWKEYGTFKELQEDMQFLIHLDQIYKSKDEEQKEAANLIALTRHFLVELTPATLSKSGRRDYGIKPHSEGKIIPFLAVHTPAKTEFGYHWEEACYYYQWAAAFAPDEKQIQGMVKNFEAMANYYVQKNGEAFHETIEYKTFQKLFGVPLDKITDPKMIEQAINNINSDTEKKLNLQYENVAKNVSFNSERVTSNGVNLNSQLSSRRAMSGTPWNVEGYSRKLAIRFEADLGTEGRILHAAAQKEKEGKIHSANLSSINNFLDSIFKEHPTPEKIRGIIETGGLFKAFQTNYDVAKEIIHFFTDKGCNNEIEGVLFFHNDPGQDEPDTLYVWKKGASQPERIGGSSVDALRAKGLNPKKYFTFYDERHTTGQDILQVPDAINLVTFDEGMLRRTFTQGIMRLRQFLSSQNIELVVTKEARELLIREGKDYEDFILSSEKVQSLRKAENMILHFQHQIDDIPRKIAIRKVIETIRANPGTKEICDVTEKYETFFVTKMIDEPYLQFGRLKHKVETKDYLRNTLEEQRQKFFKLAADDQEALEEAMKEFGEMSEHINETGCLPKFKEETPKDLGVQQEIEVHQLVQVRQQIQMNYELENEVQLELQRYEMARVTNFLYENKMSLDKFKDIVTNIKSQNTEQTSLRDQLLSYDYGFDNEPIPYHYAFSQPIYGTYNYFHSCNNILPVFHSLQRPPKQILAIRTGNSMRWLLLSELEAKHAKNHLKTLYSRKDPLSNNVWLIQPDGTKLVTDDNAEEFPTNADGLSEGLLEINAFAGNADYIDQHASDTEDWLGQHADIKIRFLKLRVAGDKEQNEILRRCQVVTQEDKEEAFNPNNHTLKDRLEKEQKNQGNFVPESHLDAKTLSPNKVKNLKAEYVCFLGIDPQKTDELTQAALEKLRGEFDVSSIDVSSIPESSIACSSYSTNTRVLYTPNDNDIKKAAEELTKKQFNNLRPFQGPLLTREQVKWLPPEKIGILDKPEQICEFDAETGEISSYALTEAQVSGLVKKQQELIPYVDPKFYRSFTQRWQIEAVPIKHINEINPDFLAFLSKKQMKNITKDLFQHLIGSGASSSTSTQVTITLPPEKYGWLPGNLIDLIPQNFLNYVQRDQIEEIDDKETLQTIEDIGSKLSGYVAGTWTQWIKPCMVPYINFESQLQYLTSKEHIVEIPIDQVPLLNNETQLPWICEEQVPGLTELQLPHCPKKLVKFLKSHQITLLNDEQYPYLRGDEQIRSINEPAKFALLHAKGDHHEGIENQMQWICEDQHALISEEQVEGLSTAQLLAIATQTSDRWNIIKEGLTQHQINSFDNQQLINLLSSRKISEFLCDSQVKYLMEPWQVRSCPNRLVHLLNSVQIQEISEGQVPYLREVCQIKHLPAELFIHLTAEEVEDDLRVNQMQWVENDRLHLVQTEQVKALSADQLLYTKEHLQNQWEEMRHHITVEQANTFNTQERFNMLDGEQIKLFAIELQIPFLLEDWQIQNCPDQLVQHLTSDVQVALIKAEQVEHLVGEEQIQACPNDLVRELTVAQIAHINEEQVQHLLGVEQVQAIGEREEYIQRLVKNQFEAMADEQFTHLSLNQISEFDRQSQLFFKITTQQLQTIQMIETVRKVPEDLVQNLIYAQFALFEKKDEALIHKLSSVQIREVTEKDITIIANIAPAQVPDLKDHLLSKLQLTKAVLIKVNSKKLHHLTFSQIRVRNLTGARNQLKYRMAGLGKMLIWSLWMLGEFIYHLSLTIFAIFRAMFRPNAVNRRKLIMSLKRTFAVGLAIGFLAPVELFHPTKYLKLESKLAASAA